MEWRTAASRPATSRRTAVVVLAAAGVMAAVVWPTFTGLAGHALGPAVAHRIEEEREREAIGHGQREG